MKVLERALRAQRHYEDAANRLADIAEVERQDPLYSSNNAAGKLERLSELARQFRTPEDQRDLDLLRTVREQLRLAEPPENTQRPVLLDALHAALEDAKQLAHADQFEGVAEDFERVLAKL